MNKATKLAFVNLNNSPFYALFHSTHVFDSRRRTQWESGWHKLKECFRNLIDGLQRFYEPGLNNKGANCWARKKGFELYEEEYEAEVETIFRSALGCNAGFYFWSLINDESPRNTSSYYFYYSNKSYYCYNNFYNNYYDNYYDYNNDNDNNNNFNYNNNNGYKKNRSSRKRGRRFEDEDDDKDEDQDEEEDDKSTRVETDFRKERIALGLSGSGPLSLEDVKNAYRACALKWHPDRHNGSFKAIAEAKFKICNAAYQSLCDKLGPK